MAPTYVNGKLVTGSVGVDNSIAGLDPGDIVDTTNVSNPDAVSAGLMSGDNISALKPGTTGYVDPYTLNNNQVGLFGLTNGYWNNIGQAAGLAGTAYNLYDNMLGNKAQMYKLQKSAMQQNMANIAEDRAAHKAFQGNIGSGFNQAMGSGLAANAAKVG